MTSRRAFLFRAIGAVGALPAARLLAQDPATADTANAADPLREPWTIGRPRDTLTALDNDPVIIATERRLRCTCGCTLDVYTCRTTDFTCTYSPAMHKEVVALYQGGKTPEEIIQVFVAREGEQILMAPPAEGFNIAGYVVPGLVMLTGALGLAAWLTRRRQAVALAEGGAAATAPLDAMPAPDAEQREKLRRALDDVED
jgi:cytochrome c-type biogenesis protein CcmH